MNIYLQKLFLLRMELGFKLIFFRLMLSYWTLLPFTEIILAIQSIIAKYHIQSSLWESTEIKKQKQMVDTEFIQFISKISRCSSETYSAL